MRASISCLSLVLAAFALAQGPEQGDIETLIKKLHSKSYQERESAQKALLVRPEAERKLRDLLKSPDAEVRKRVGEILDFYDRRPVRELSAAVKDGQINRVVEMLASWPKGKYEEDVWASVRQLATQLAEIHEKKGGKSIAPLKVWGSRTPEVISEKRITVRTKAELERRYFLRGEIVDLTRNLGDPPCELDSSGLIAASGSVKTGRASLILAGGSVDLLGRGENTIGAIIVSGGEIRLESELFHSLVIARGSVECRGMRVEGNRIISGKAVRLANGNKENTISENDPNPLGFIRWADAPKDKVEPKKK